MVQARMGTVHAQASAPPPDQIPPPPPEAPVDTPTDHNASTPPDEGPRFPRNPGSYEEIRRKVMDLFPHPMDGCKIMLNKGMSQNLQCQHTFNLGSGKAPFSYQFATVSVGSRQLSPSEVYPVCRGDFNFMENSLMANYVDLWGERLRTKVVFQPKDKMIELSGEYIGNTFTAGMTMVNPNPLESSGIGVGHYLQAITSNLTVGAELVYQAAQSQQMSTLSLASRYTGSNWSIAGTLGSTALYLGYYHKANDNLQVGIEYECNLQMQKNSVQLGYQLDLPQALTSFKGMVGSNGTIGSSLEKRFMMQYLPCSLIFSAMYDLKQSRGQYGFGLTLG